MSGCTAGTHLLKIYFLFFSRLEDTVVRALGKMLSLSTYVRRVNGPQENENVSVLDVLIAASERLENSYTKMQKLLNIKA